MKKIVDFLIEANKLKEMPRTGWVLMKVKDPETVAEHIWGVAISAWLLGEENNLNIEKLIKIAFTHDLCEVYAGDITPFFYYNRSSSQEALMKWVRLSKKEKEKRGQKKFAVEKKSLLRLIKNLPMDLGKQFFSYWLDSKKRITREGKFIAQVDRIDTLIRSIEYFGSKKEIGGTSWWEGTEEMIDDPLLLKLLKVIQYRFYGKIPGHKKDVKLEDTFDCLLKIAKLKRMQRLYWIIRGIKKPETVAGHIFTLTLMALVLGKEAKPKLNMEKLLKMALCHEITAVYTGDTTPYDRILSTVSLKDKSEILKKWPRLPKMEKRKIFLADYKEEKRALEKLTKKLCLPLRKEMIQLWQEYRTRSTPEGHFLSQLNVLAVLLQALLYEKQYKSFSAAPIWEWAFEISDNPVNFKLMDEMKKRFYG